MAKVAVTPDGVSALRSMSQGLLENIETIKRSTNDLQNAYDENRAALAPNADSLGQVIQDVRDAANEASEPVEGLSDRVQRLADKYQEVIDDDPFSGISGN